MGYQEKTARYYDYFASKEALPFFRRLFLKLGGPVLDVGTATGRVALDLAHAGLNVVGVDKCPYLLEIARQKLDKQPPSTKERLSFVEDDIISMSLDKTFASVFFGGGTFSHLLNSNEQLRCLYNVHKLLDDGGHLVFDLPAPNPDMLKSSTEVSRTVPLNGDSSLLRTVHTRCDVNNQRLVSTVIYERYRGEAMQERVMSEVVTSIIFPREILLVLSSAGYKLADFWGDTSGTGFRADSKRMIIVAEKN